VAVVQPQQTIKASQEIHLLLLLVLPIIQSCSSAHRRSQIEFENKKKLTACCYSNE
jgi:hypothetical protein